MIAVIFIGNIEYCPYFGNYKSLLEKESVAYDLFYWNRMGLKTVRPDNYYSFEYPKKIISFYKYRLWLKENLHRKKYEKYIILDTLSGFLISSELKQRKYIYEIRDYSYERFLVYKYIEKRLIARSYTTFISSPGFKSFLPPGNYMIFHNIAHSDQEDFLPMDHIQRESDVIILVWAGTIRYFETQLNIIRQLKNDNRFRIYYHGDGYDLEKLKDICRKEKINNVFFTGRYDESEKIDLMRKADIILNAYDINIGEEVRYALSNRFYDALMLGLPQIVEKDSYKCKIVQKHDLGIILDENLKKNIIASIDRFRTEKFRIKCRRFYDSYKKENIRSLEKIRSFLNLSG